jgi:hypothetical protein
MRLPLTLSAAAAPRRLLPGQEEDVMRRGSAVLGLLLAVMALLALAAPAPARPPVTETVPDSGTFVIAENCPGGYDVVITWNNTIRITTFYDAAGEVVRVVTHSDGSGTISNSVTGYTLEGSSPSIETTWIRPQNPGVDSGDKVTVGLYLKNTVPGEGIVLLDAGRVVFDAAGNATWWSAQTEPRVTGAGSVDWCGLVD